MELAKELQGKAMLAKFNCNKYNKELGISLGIKVAPTFLLYKGGEQVQHALSALASLSQAACYSCSTEQTREHAVVVSRLLTKALVAAVLRSP